MKVEEIVLMQEGPWQLMTTADLESHEPNLHSWIVHHCPNRESREYGNCWWNLSIINRSCDGCDEYPPTGIMGLWKLHNFDYIQQGSECT